jgi:hypothetical protein
MRILQKIALLAALASGPALAQAKPWQGVVPGTTVQSEVVTRFGEPSTQGKLGGRTALVYKGEQAIAGTKQAQFFLRDDGRVAEITVFPASQLDKDSVEGTYGKGAQKTFTDDFKPVWVFRSIGVMVFFAKDGSVEAISFKAPESAATHAAPAAAAPSAQAAKDQKEPASTTGER